MSRQILSRTLPLVALLACCQHWSSMARAGTEDSYDAAGGRARGNASREVIGWLVPNSAHPNVDAPYVLTDKSGDVGYYLEPSAGVQLDRYVNKRVRVRGTEYTMRGESTRILRIDQVGSPENAPRPNARHDRGAAPPVRRKVRQIPAEEIATEPNDEEIQLTAANGEQDDWVEPTPDSVGDAGLTPIPEKGGQQDAWSDLPSQGGPSCGGCNRSSCKSCCGTPCGIPGNFWVRAEYLYWATEGMHLPPLVTTGPSAAQPGFLGSPGTQILFGGDRVNGNGRSGGRISAGMWLNPCRTFGVEGDYFGLASVTTSYSATSTGNPILSRPFFDTRPDLAAQNVEQVASPGVIAGTVSVLVPTQFSGAGVSLRYNLCCGSQCYSCSCLPSLNGQGGYRFDALLGYRFYRLSDGVGITENLTALNPAGAFIVNDSFTTKNLFNGVEFGTAMQWYRGRWTLELLSRLAMGNNAETVTINGSTVTTQNGASSTAVGGLLAQPSNIGLYQRNEFAVVPQLNLNLAYQITPGLRALVGYSFIYWSRVVRAGDQIDTSVNSNVLPNHPPITGPIGDTTHPQFVFRDTDFWAQGVNVGLDYRW